MHNAVRDLVMDGADREEIRAMLVEVQLGFEAGARTLSFGLIYMPGAFSDIEELIELAEAGMQDSAIAALEVTISRSGC